jgi:2-amino-4-hydroxy-6-hydroxymethyldihydropteridine diphosphokinase
VHVVTLGLGANLGDRLATLQRAVDLLADEGIRMVASSRVWQTEPVGGPAGQPAYLNAVVRAETGLDASVVLAAAHRVEAALGRIREVRWGPRTIDIDVLLYDDLERDDPELTIPHPRLRERAFVILPLLDIDPAPVLPDGTRVLDLAVDPDGAEPVDAPLALP